MEHPPGKSTAKRVNAGGKKGSPFVGTSMADEVPGPNPHRVTPATSTDPSGRPCHHLSDDPRPRRSPEVPRVLHPETRLHRSWGRQSLWILSTGFPLPFVPTSLHVLQEPRSDSPSCTGEKPVTPPSLLSRPCGGTRSQVRLTWGGGGGRSHS